MYEDHEKDSMNVSTGKLLDVKYGEKNKEVSDTMGSDGLKKKYGQIYQVEVAVDMDDESEGRTLKFIFKTPTAASFNRYLKSASKNMAAATVIFVEDNIIDEHRADLKKEQEQYPGLALNIGQKLLSIIGLGDSINFKRL